MTFKGIPFIWSRYSLFEGLDLNALVKEVNGNASNNQSYSKGMDITGFVKWCQYDKKKFSDSEQIGNTVDNTGFDITDAVKNVDGDNKGFDVTGMMKFVDGNNKGCDLTGILKAVDRDNKGLSITGLYNHFGIVNDWSISYATLGNVIKEVRNNAFYLQIGLFNKAGDHYCPIINIGGIKNLSKLLNVKGENKK